MSPPTDSAGDLAPAGRPVKMEILYFDCCPSHEALLPRARALAAQHGAEVELRRVETAEAALSERFIGSPTVRVDGEDVEPGAAQRADFGLTCRVYPSAEGRSPLPPDEWIVDALRRAQAR